MRKTLSSLVVAVLLACPGAVCAGDFETGVEAFVAGDYATAFRDFRKAADQGDTQAQNILGMMYAAGHVLPQDYADAATRARRDGARWSRRRTPRCWRSNGPPVARACR